MCRYRPPGPPQSSAWGQAARLVHRDFVAGREPDLGHARAEQAIQDIDRAPSPVYRSQVRSPSTSSASRSAHYGHGSDAAGGRPSSRSAGRSLRCSHLVRLVGRRGRASPPWPHAGPAAAQQRLVRDRVDPRVGACGDREDACRRRGAASAARPCTPHGSRTDRTCGSPFSVNTIFTGTSRGGGRSVLSRNDRCTGHSQDGCSGSGHRTRAAFNC